MKNEQILKLEKALAVKGLPADERELFEATLRKLRAEVPEQIMKANLPRPQPVQAFQAIVQEPIAQSAPAAPKRRPIYDHEDMPTVTVEAVTGPGKPKVTIVWQDEGRTAETVTEGEARSRFTSCLRDLRNSKRAQQERWDDLALTIGFYRLCTYYKALTAFWGAPPSPQQLEINPLGRVSAHIFNMIEK